MRKIIYLTAVLFLSIHFTVLGETPSKQSPKLKPATHIKKGNASYSVNKDNRKTKKMDKPTALKELKTSDPTKKATQSPVSAEVKSTLL